MNESVDQNAHHMVGLGQKKGLYIKDSMIDHGQFAFAMNVWLLEEPN